MGKVHKVEAKITFLSKEEGGRDEPLMGLSNKSYRPHLVVGDISQREAIVIEKELEMDGRIRHMKNFIDEEYLCVTFLSGPEIALPGETIACVLGLFAEHSALVPEATFTIREGAKIVGYGEVLKRWEGEF